MSEKEEEEEGEERGVIRMDLILSYWIFVWWLLYEMGIVSVNPKLMLIIGLIVNMLMLLMKVLRGSATVLPFVIINTVIKVLPLLMLMKTSVTKEDVKGSLKVVLIYVVWLIINKETVMENVKRGARPPFENWWVK